MCGSTWTAWWANCHPYTETVLWSTVLFGSTLSLTWLFGYNLSHKQSGFPVVLQPCCQLTSPSQLGRNRVSPATKKDQHQFFSHKGKAAPPWQQPTINPPLNQNPIALTVTIEITTLTPATVLRNSMQVKSSHGLREANDVLSVARDMKWRTHLKRACKVCKEVHLTLL